MMICKNCGADNDGGSRFCVHCGAPLTDVSAPAPQAAAGPIPVPLPDNTMTVLDHPPLPGSNDGSAYRQPGVPASSGVAGAPTAPGASQTGPTAPGALPQAVPGASGVPSAPAAPVAPGAATPPSGTTTATATLPNPSGKRGPNTLIIALVAVLLALIVAGVATFLTYRAEVWGGKSLPDPASIAASVTDKNAKKASVIKAKDVTEALKAKGLNAKTVPVFSGEDRGVFLGYEGTNPGARVKAGSTVIVQESAGPGVPKGTVGKDVNKVVNTFADMGVPIHYKKVVISSDSKTPEGQVSVTYPAPGVGLTDDEKDNGIYIGVASKGDGIPVDILGSDKNKAVSDLESQGYSVDSEPHYSSEKYVGKISGSYPAPGSTLSSGQSVTLYYGIDKSSNMDVLSKTNSYDNIKMASIHASAMIGMYCKSEVTDAAKDCITLEQSSMNPFGATSPEDYQYLQIKGHEPEDKADVLGLTNFSQDVSGAMLESDSEHGMSADKLPMKNHLLLKDWGMFELYAGMDLPNCGSKVMSASIGEYCVNGNYERASFDDGEMTPPAGAENGSTGMTYDMKDFLVYFPAGSDAESLDDSGYFDAAELAKAKKQKAVDTSRPYILVRDKSLYSETSVSVNLGKDVDPFVPTNRSINNYQNKMEPMKPAPSDSTVYYLVEQNGDLDWDSLPDAEVKGTGDKSKDSGKQDATFKEAMKQAAGNYSFGSGVGAWGTVMKVNKDGTFSGSYHDSDMGATGDGYPYGSRAESNFTGKFKSAKKNSDGTYTLQCDASAFKIDGTVGESHIEDQIKVTISEPYGMEPCNEFTLYTDGTDLSTFSDAMKTWSNGYLIGNDVDTLNGKALLNVTSGADKGYTFYDFS
ncbi:PASTA domain-containing protein [Bifidobacterium longum]|nr:PASTA domain-containing protein [Bifidobacterium longum]MDW3163784.1 PASTA domain-containing protein [Bifidobacterium longum]GDZ74769.1 serine/threonine protein kinase [Bifidobacteriaceae bacterium MCC01989]